MWSSQEFKEFNIIIFFRYCDSLCKTTNEQSSRSISLTVEDEGYEKNTGQIKVPRGQSSREIGQGG